MRKKQIEYRIKYYRKEETNQEFFIFDFKFTDEKEWKFEAAYEIIADMISYQALTKIRAIQDFGYPFHFE